MTEVCLCISTRGWCIFDKTGRPPLWQLLRVWLIELPAPHCVFGLISFKMRMTNWWILPLRCRDNSSFHPLSVAVPNLPPPHLLITPSPSPGTLSPSYSHYRFCRCCSRISSQCGCWTWGGMTPAGWQKVKTGGEERKVVEGGVRGGAVGLGPEMKRRQAAD